MYRPPLSAQGDRLACARLNEKGVLHPVGRVGTGFTEAGCRGACGSGSTHTDSTQPVRRALERRRRARRALRQAGAGGGGGVARLDRGRHLRHASSGACARTRPRTRSSGKRCLRREETKPAPQRRTVKLTHPDRVLWPDAGVTKQGLADYYAEVWPLDRAAMWSDGRSRWCAAPAALPARSFFQKHAWKGLSRDIVLINDPGSRRAAAHHHRGSRRADGSRAGRRARDPSLGLDGRVTGSSPTRIVIDLDPGDGVRWPDVIAAAGEVRERLRRAGSPLRQDVRRQGPARGRAAEAEGGMAAVKAFTKAIADAWRPTVRERYVSTITKIEAARQRIFVDYLRNGRARPRSPPIRRGRGRVRRCRRRSPGTSSARPSARPTSPSAIRRHGSPRSPPIRGRISAPPRRRLRLPSRADEKRREGCPIARSFAPR